MTEIKLGFSLPFLLTGILAWFVYGSLNGVLSMILLDILLSISILIALIPFAGIFMMATLTEVWIIPTVLSFTHVEYTWLVTVLKFIAYFCGTIVTMFTTAIVMKWYKI